MKSQEAFLLNCDFGAYLVLIFSYRETALVDCAVFLGKFINNYWPLYWLLKNLII